MESKINEAFEKWQVDAKYTGDYELFSVIAKENHEITNLQVMIYQERKLAWAESKKQSRIDTLKEMLPKIEEVFFILKDIPQSDYEHDEEITDAHNSAEETVKHIDTEIKKGE